MLSPSQAASTVILLMACASALAQSHPPIVCPQRHTDKAGHSGKLILASVFDGVPEKKADLIPDLSTGEWDLSSAQQDTKERGESFYLVCQYKGIKDTARFQLSYDIKSCKLEPAKGEIRAYCQ